MAVTKASLSAWINPLLQGLSFWLGYKNQLYRHYPLSEGAIVGEAVQLIYRNLGSKEELHCEVMYRTMHTNIKGMGNARADMVIKANDEPKVIIEIKRVQTQKLLHEDFIKLSKIKKVIPKVQCFLLLVSQSLRPKTFVTAKGTAIKKLIKTDDYALSVRRVCKASNSFRNTHKANYACLIEVINR